MHCWWKQAFEFFFEILVSNRPTDDVYAEKYLTYELIHIW